MTPETIKYIETCANEHEHASVQRLSCADVRGLLKERELLIAVSNAAKVFTVASNLYAQANAKYCSAYDDLKEAIGNLKNHQ